MKKTLLTGIVFMTIVSAGFSQEWVIQNCGVNSVLNAVAFGNKNDGVIAGNNGVVKTTDNGGATWGQPAGGIPNVDYRAADVSHDTTHGNEVKFVAGSNGTIISQVGTTGVWQPHVTPTTEALNDIQIIGAIGFAVGGNGTILKTTSAGNSWLLLNVPAAAGIWLTKVSIDPNNPNFITIIGEGGFVLQSLNGGATWNQQSLPGGVYLGSVQYTAPDKGWVSGSEGQLYSFTGSVFTPYNTGTTNGIMGLGFVTENFGFGVGDNGYITQWNGTSWTPQTSPTTAWLNDVSVLTDDFMDNSTDYSVYAWAVGQDGVLISTVQNVVGMGNKHNESLVISPNPTSGKFRFTGMDRHNINLQVFDMSGRQLTDMNTSSDGLFDLGWLNPGLYTLKIRQGNSVNLQKLIIQAN